MVDKLIITKDGIIEVDFTPEEIAQREAELLASRPTLSEIQQQKIIELNTACNQDILNGFSSFCTDVEHQYKFDIEYQGNFGKKMALLALVPTIQTIDWPTSDAGVVPHAREQFIQLAIDGQTHMESKLFRYFEMKAQILAPTITTVEQVEVFVW